MTLTTMYPAKNNSPTTALSADINSSDTSITVDDASVLPDAPNLAVIGTTGSAEIVLVTAINSNTLTVVRGQHGTVPGVWEAGTEVARNFTAMDHDNFMSNILDLDERKTDSGHTHDDRYYTEGETDTLLSAKAPLASPALTGTPTAPTAASDTNSTQVATTEFVQTAAGSAKSYDNAGRDTLLAFTESLRGKKVSIIGDSISTFSGYVPDGYSVHYPTGTVTNVDQTWWKMLIDYSGATLEANLSYSGSAASNVVGGTSPDFYDRCSTSLLGSPDVIFVELGTNDSAQSVSIGQFDFTTTYTSLSESTFATAYIKGIKALKALYPNAEIICIALNMGYQYAMSIRYIATQLGCVFINSENYIKESGSHPGAVGMKQVFANLINNAGFQSNNGLITGNAGVDGNLLFYVNQRFDTYPSNTITFPSIYWSGYNNDNFVLFRPYYYNSGLFLMRERVSNGTKTENFDRGIDSNGDPYVSVTTPVAWQKGLGLYPIAITSSVTFKETVGNWTTVYASSTTVYINYQGENKAHTADTTSGHEIFTLPSGYTPHTVTVVPITGATKSIYGTIRINTDGKAYISMISDTTTSDRLTFSCSFPI